MHPLAAALVVVVFLPSCELRVTAQPPGARTAYTIGAAGGRLLSGDGVLLARVAPGSGAPDTLDIATIDPARLSAQFVGHEVVAAYELGPAGSQFSPPVMVELDLAAIPGLVPGDGTPLLWHSEGAGFELVSGQTLVEGGPDGTFVIRGALPHFSSVVLTRGTEMQLSFTSDDLAEVGQPIAASGELRATAASQAQALAVVMHAKASGGLTAGEQGRDFGALDGGLQAVDRAYDPVTCELAGVGVFDLRGVFTGFTTVANGARTKAATVNRAKAKRVLCHVASGTTSVGGPGTAIGGAVQTLSVAPEARAVVGQTFDVEVAFVGRTGAQGLTFATSVADIVDAPTAATPNAVGAATDVTIDGTGAKLSLGGNGGVRVRYRCARAGETGLAFTTSVAPTMTVTTRVTCTAPPPPEGGGGR